MQLYLRLAIIAAIILILDSIYIGFNRQFLFRQLESVQKSPVVLRYSGAILCYIILVLGLYYFVLRHTSNSLRRQVMDATLLGLVIYGVYETTCYATFKNWTTQMLVMDTLWGGIVFGLTTYIYNKIRI
jgi:uncharacterized membrane protein